MNMIWYDNIFLGIPDEDENTPLNHLAKGAGADMFMFDENTLETEDQDYDCDYWRKVMKEK